MIKYGQNINIVPIAYITKSERTFVITQSIDIELSDGRIITIPEGFKTDLASSPRYSWSFYSPFDKALLADIIHDYLWVNKIKEIEYFGSIYDARKFADNERNLWRKLLAPNLKFKNFISHKIIRWIGGLYYSNQLKLKGFKND